MEYRIFGPGRSPYDEFTAELQAFCELDNVQREALAVWFETTSDFNTYTPDLPAGIRASSLLPEQFRKAAAPIRYLLNAWYERSLQVADIERDLLLLGLSPEHIQVVTTFLQRLSPIKERIWRDGREGHAQAVGLPRLDDANIVWDTRGVFGAPAFQYSGEDADEAAYARCLGLTCVGILEFLISDIDGLEQRIALQVTEDEFRSLLRAFNRAAEQLGSLKALIGPMTVPQMGSKA